MSAVCPVCQNPVEAGATSCPKCNFRLTAATQQFVPVGPAQVASPAQPVSQEAHMRMVRGPQVGITFPLTKDIVTIGRNPSSDIFLNDMTVSREHAHVEREGEAYVIRDLHSFNGVWINNKTVDAHVLRPGDYVQIGKYDFVFETA